MTATGNTGSNSEIRRPLSPVERWYWVCDQISPLNVIARVHVSGAMAPGLLADAAAALVLEHPLLRVAIAAADDGSDPEFVAATEARLPIRHVDGSDPAAWEREVDRFELATSVNWRTGAMARLVDVVSGERGSAGESHDLVLTISHIIADGTTALALLQRVVELAALLSDDDDRTVESVARPRPALPSPEGMLPRKFVGAPGFARVVGAGVVDQAVAAAARANRLQPEVPVPAHERITRLTRRSLTAEQVAVLLDRCRREGVTVHGALSAAVAAAVGRIVAPDGGKVCVGSPIDFRSELEPPVPADAAGAYVATVPTYIDVGSDVDFWTTAGRVNRELDRRKRFRQHLALIATLKLVAPKSVGASERTVALVDSRGPGNVCISNIGRYDFADRIGPWALSGAQFIAGVSISGFFVVTVNTSHDTLHLNFTYIDTVVSEDRANRLADDCVRTLLGALDHTGSARTVQPRPVVAKRRGNRMSDNRGAVVVTGASSGLGRETALALARSGFVVYAGVRREESAAELQREFPGSELRPLLLDVTSTDSIRRAHDRIAAEIDPGGLIGVVNNAGICVSAPLECVSIEDFRAELEVNLVGTVAMTRQFLPLLRAFPADPSGKLAGRIVNVSSGVGRLAAPFLGAYAASQFGKEGVSDSLRRELAPLSVSVSLIEPGAILTPIWGKLSDTAERILGEAKPDVAELYRNRFTSFVTANEERANASRTKPADVAKAIEHALTASRPKARYRVGIDSWASTIASRVLPDRVLDFVMAAGISAGEKHFAAVD